jgi:hypothetical protein
VLGTSLTSQGGTHHSEWIFLRPFRILTRKVVPSQTSEIRIAAKNRWKSASGLGRSSRAMNGCPTTSGPSPSLVRRITWRSATGRFRLSQPRHAATTELRWVGTSDREETPRSAAS